MPGFSNAVRHTVRLAIVAIACGAVPVLLTAGSDATRPHAGGNAPSIMGAAWTAANTPIAGAHVQLRDVVTGKIRGSAVADEAGRFTFTNIERGTYVVELLDASGKVVTVGHAFVIGPGETVATFVRLGNRAPWFTGFFNNAASTVVSTASSQGIVAVAPVQLPSSPQSSVR